MDGPTYDYDLAENRYGHSLNFCRGSTLQDATRRVYGYMSPAPRQGLRFKSAAADAQGAVWTVYELEHVQANIAGRPDNFFFATARVAEKWRKRRGSSTWEPIVAAEV